VKGDVSVQATILGQNSAVAQPSTNAIVTTSHRAITKKTMLKTRVLKDRHDLSFLLHEAYNGLLSLGCSLPLQISKPILSCVSISQCVSEPSNPTGTPKSQGTGRVLSIVHFSGVGDMIV
jgi:hypothetical protein